MQLLWLTQKLHKIMSQEGSGLCLCAGRALVQRAFRDPLLQSASEDFPKASLWSIHCWPTGSSLGRLWILRWKLSCGKKTLIWIRSIRYATVALSQSFCWLGSFFASFYKFKGVLLVIIKEVAFMLFCFMLFSLYWRRGVFNIYALTEYLNP